MKMQIYCLRDRHVGFLTPQFEQNEPAAIRNFEHLVSQKGNLVNFRPKDFDMYMIGEYETDSGEIQSCTPILIANGGDFDVEE